MAQAHPEPIDLLFAGEAYGLRLAQEVGGRFVPLGARIYVHLNNSNPLVDPASPERAQAQAAGWQIGHDGMEIAP